MLQAVRLDCLIYPCWYYALSRIGKKSLFSERWLREEMPEMCSRDAAVLEEGDLLIWDAPPEEVTNASHPVYIQSNGQIINKPVIYNCHVGVYEGHGLVSDMVAAWDQTLPFVIRMRDLADFKRGPDRILRWGK